jgi:hypothetical protein
MGMGEDALKEVKGLIRTVGSLLSSFGFHETSTPCLFKHVSHPIYFVLVVDDFGFKYKNRSDFNSLSLVFLFFTMQKSIPSFPSFLASPSLTTATPALLRLSNTVYSSNSISYLLLF